MPKTGDALVGEKVSVKGVNHFYSGFTGKILRYEGRNRYIVDMGNNEAVLNRDEFTVDSMKRRKRRRKL